MGKQAKYGEQKENKGRLFKIKTDNRKFRTKFSIVCANCQNFRTQSKI
jgi:hypothetical protein